VEDCLPSRKRLDWYSTRLFCYLAAVLTRNALKRCGGEAMRPVKNGQYHPPSDNHRVRPGWVRRISDRLSQDLPVLFLGQIVVTLAATQSVPNEI